MCPRVAIALSSLKSCGSSTRNSMGNAGQISSISSICVQFVQTSRRSRRRGAANMMYCHRRHTCTSISQLAFHSSYPLHNCKQKSNISTRTSSRNTSVAMQPTSKQSAVVGGGSPQKMYLELVPPQRSDVRDAWPPINSRKGNLLEAMT